MNLISIQSHVAYGHVGNAAATFPLQRIGVEVWPIHTVQFSNHTGYGEWTGRVFDGDMIREVFAGIEKRGVLGECDGILSGYMGSADIGTAILETVATVKQTNVAAQYCCDPVIGDVGRGIFVREGIPEFMRDKAVPAADIITPNQFELEYLAGHETHTMAQAFAAIDDLHERGPRAVMVTSLHTEHTPADCIDLLASDAKGRFHVRTPKLPLEINGAGDAIAALFFAQYLREGDIGDALSLAASAVFGILCKTLESGSREILLVEAQDEIVKPSKMFEAKRLGAGMKAMRRRFVTLDVFTLKRFSGNPLAVVFEPEGLDTDAMQAIAREFNYPETVFVLPAQDKAHRAKLRIFTPAAELPFAGHPTVGTAVALARGGDKQQAFVLSENIGPVACEVTLRDADSGEARFALPQLPLESGTAPDASAIAAALSLGAGDIGGDFKPACWATGLGFVYVPVKSLEAMAKARPDPAQFERTFAMGTPGKAYLFCRETTDAGSDFHVRMFAPGMGIPEDPATGSAAASLGGLLAAQANLKDGTHRFRIEQGYEMGRPSQIDLTVEIASGKLTGGSIGGGAVVVCEGHIEA